MAPAGAEFFIGFPLQPQFGPVISLGLGGISSSSLPAMWLFGCSLPQRPIFAKWLSELNAWPKLKKGFRHCRRSPRTHSSIGSSGGRVRPLTPVIRELDLNPVIAAAEGMAVVEATVVVDENGGRRTPGIIEG